MSTKRGRALLDLSLHVALLDGRDLAALVAAMGHAQDTLTPEESAEYTLYAQPGEPDNGINVLIDDAHQFLFFGAWHMPAWHELSRPIY